MFDVATALSIQFVLWLYAQKSLWEQANSLEEEDDKYNNL